MNFNIKQARVYSNKTQEEMAEALKVHVDTYRNIEKNPGKATIEQAKTIAEVTGINIDQLFFA
ncbi:MAG: helix-turn-helix transcriptional regulator [Negativicutes bacterium]